MRSKRTTKETLISCCVKREVETKIICYLYSFLKEIVVFLKRNQHKKISPPDYEAVFAVINVMI